VLVVFVVLVLVEPEEAQLFIHTTTINVRITISEPVADAVNPNRRKFVFKFWIEAAATDGVMTEFPLSVWRRYLIAHCAAPTSNRRAQAKAYKDRRGVNGN
jgi:hypothetical protein